jgi:hypothetical protein
MSSVIASPSRGLVATLFVLLVIASGITVPQSLHGQEVHGRVLSAESGSPIELARVRLIDLASGAVLDRITDAQGRFRVRVEGLVNRLEVSAFGYLSHVDSVYLGSPDESLEVEVLLGAEAIPLDPLVVVGARRPVWESTEPKYLWEFFEREEYFDHLGGESRFFDRGELDMLVGSVGSLSRLEQLWPLQTLQGRRKCTPGSTRFFLDGFEFKTDHIQGGGESIFHEIAAGIGDIAAVEVYYGAAIPAEFITDRKPTCRVMAIWRKRPAVPDEIGEGEPRSWLLPLRLPRLPAHGQGPEPGRLRP